MDYVQKILNEHGEGAAEKLAIAHEANPELLAALINEGNLSGWSWSELEDHFIERHNLEFSANEIENGRKRSLVQRYKAAAKFNSKLLHEVASEFRKRSASFEEVLDAFSVRVVTSGLGDIPEIMQWSEEIIPTGANR